MRLPTGTGWLGGGYITIYICISRLCHDTSEISHIMTKLLQNWRRLGATHGSNISINFNVGGVGEM